MTDEVCPICEGKGVIILINTPCTFCNETGEYTKTAEQYMLNHTCQCILLDRKRCPLCKKTCHHDTTNRPSLTIEPM